MPLYDFRCDVCGRTLVDHYRSMGQIEMLDLPECCSKVMEIHWAPRSYKPFPSFTTTNIDGTPREINSLHEIRKLEKQHEKTKLCWEPGSFNSKYGDL